MRQATIPMRTPFPLTPLRCKDVHHDGVLVQMRDALLRRLGRLRLVPQPHARSAAVSEDVVPRDDAAVLRFPIRGEALLANLANTLRDRVAHSEQDDDPFLMTMSRNARPRLSLDRDAYVEFHAEDDSFRLKIDAAPASRLTLETTEFTTLVKFILQYLAERHGDPEQGGDAR
jgi:hypothetical protein